MQWQSCGIVGVFPAAGEHFMQKSFMKLRFENAVVLIIYFDAKPPRIIYT